MIETKVYILRDGIKWHWTPPSSSPVQSGDWGLSQESLGNCQNRNSVLSSNHMNQLLEKAWQAVLRHYRATWHWLDHISLYDLRHRWILHKCSRTQRENAKSLEIVYWRIRSEDTYLIVTGMAIPSRITETKLWAILTSDTHAVHTRLMISTPCRWPQFVNGPCL